VGVVADCRRGECGLCVVDIVSFTGTIDHRDVFFSKAQHAENRKICVCVSRGELTIDASYRGDEPLRSGPEIKRPVTA